MVLVLAPMVADFPGNIGGRRVYVAFAKYIFAGYILLYPKHDHLHVEDMEGLFLCPENGLIRACCSLSGKALDTLIYTKLSCIAMKL